MPIRVQISLTINRISELYYWRKKENDLHDKMSADAVGRIRHLAESRAEGPGRYFGYFRDPIFNQFTAISFPALISKLRNTVEFQRSVRIRPMR